MQFCERGGGSPGKRKRIECLNFMTENHSFEHVYRALRFVNVMTLAGINIKVTTCSNKYLLFTVWNVNSLLTLNCITCRRVFINILGLSEVLELRYYFISKLRTIWNFSVLTLVLFTTLKDISQSFFQTEVRQRYQKQNASFMIIYLLIKKLYRSSKTFGTPISLIICRSDTQVYEV